MSAVFMILLFLGLVLVIVGGAFSQNPPRVNLAWAGVACWMLAGVLRLTGAA